MVLLAEYYANNKSDSCKMYCDKAESYIEKHLQKNKGPRKELKQLLARVFYLQGSRSLREGTKLTTTESYYNRAYELYQAINDDLGMAKILSAQSFIHQRNGNNIKYEATIYQANKLSNNTNNLKAIATINKTKSAYFHYTGNIDSAIYYMQQALKIYEAQNDAKSVAYCVGNLGVQYQKKDNYEKALEYSFKGLEICNKANYKKGSMFILISIGDLYVTMSKYARSINFLKSAQEISLKQANVQAELMIANLLSTSYDKLNQQDSALKYSNRVLNIIEESDFGREYESDSYNRISIVYKKRNNLSQALFYAKKSIETYRSPNLSSKASKLHNLGDIYFRLGQVDIAINLIKESFNIYKNNNDKAGSMKASLLLSDIYAKLRVFEKAYHYFKQAETIEDSLYNYETEQILAENETKFKLQKKEYEIENKKKEIILLKKDKQLKNYTILGFLLLFISGTLTFFTFFQRKKTKELEARNQIIYQINQVRMLNEKIDNLESNTSNFSNNTFTLNLNNALDNPLSEREIEVLAELSNGLTNKAISEKLFVSVNTVKTHIKNIYTKLDVNNRTQAVKKSRNPIHQ